MENRRNLYRLLHVQPDAPAPIIKASYRTIMQTLRQHPDLGGEVDTAQLLNEAVATLCDPARRARYDLERSRSNTRKNKPSEAGQHFAPQQSTALDDAVIGSTCLFCKAPTPSVSHPSFESYGDDGLCQRCGGAQSLAGRQLSDAVAANRNEHRAACSAIATLWQQWPLSHPVGVRVVDLSARGAALHCHSEISPQRNVLLKSFMINAIAQVHYCLPVARPPVDGIDHYRVGLRLSTLRMTSPPGGFLAVKA